MQSVCFAVVCHLTKQYVLRNVSSVKAVDHVKLIKIVFRNDSIHATRVLRSDSPFYTEEDY